MPVVDDVENREGGEAGDVREHVASSGNNHARMDASRNRSRRFGQAGERRTLQEWVFILQRLPDEPTGPSRQQHARTGRPSLLEVGMRTGRLRERIALPDLDSSAS